jgi:pilin isopeptide linkage protein/LPXTG-motif cell wall-anchored protein
VEESGALQASAVYTGNGVFTNTYTPAAGSIVLSAEKRLEGRNLVAGEFTFELLDESGEVIQTQTNTGEGTINFDEITYEKAGEYHYTIREQQGIDSTVTYDQHEYQVTVKVTDTEGLLKASIVDPENIVFNNSIKKTPSKTPALPKTGEMNQVGISIMGILLIGSVVFTYHYKKKRQKRMF